MIMLMKHVQVQIGYMTQILTGYAGVTGTGDIGAGIRQSVYLDSKVLYLRGDGTSANPFTIE